MLLFGTYCSGDWGQTAPSGARGLAPRWSAKRVGLRLAFAVALACAREAQGGGSASRCAGLVPPAHLARRVFLRRALWGEPARLARGWFCAGVKPLEGERIFCVAVRLALLGGAAWPCRVYRLGHAANRAPAPAATQKIAIAWRRRGRKTQTKKRERSEHPHLLAQRRGGKAPDELRPLRGALGESTVSLTLDQHPDSMRIPAQKRGLCGD